MKFIKFTTVPHIVRAVQLTDENFYDIIKWLELNSNCKSVSWSLYANSKYISITKLNSNVLRLRKGDWLIVNSNDELRMSSHEDFLENYIIEDFDKNIIG